MDVVPYVKNGRTCLSLRYLANAVGVVDQDITWDPATRTMTLKKGDITLYLTVSSKVMRNQVDLLEPMSARMDVAPEVVNGRVCLPAGYVADGFGYQVKWDEREKAIVVALSLR